MNNSCANRQINSPDMNYITFLSSYLVILEAETAEIYPILKVVIILSNLRVGDILEVRFSYNSYDGFSTLEYQRYPSQKETHIIKALIIIVFRIYSLHGKNQHFIR
jgi:hypothetical protein